MFNFVVMLSGQFPGLFHIRGNDSGTWLVSVRDVFIQTDKHMSGLAVVPGVEPEPVALVLLVEIYIVRR